MAIVQSPPMLDEQLLTLNYADSREMFSKIHQAENDLEYHTLPRDRHGQLNQLWLVALFHLQDKTNLGIKVLHPRTLLWAFSLGCSN